METLRASVVYGLERGDAGRVIVMDDDIDRPGRDRRHQLSDGAMVQQERHEQAIGARLRIGDGAGDAFARRHAKLNEAICELIDDFSLVQFGTLDISSRESVGRALKAPMAAENAQP